MSLKNDSHRTETPSAKDDKPWSLALRLTIWYAGSAFVILLVATGILYWALVTTLDRQDDQFLVDEVHILHDLLAERPEYVDAIRQEIEWEAVSRKYARVYVRLIGPEGRIVAETPGMNEMLPVEVFPDAVAESGSTVGVDAASHTGTPYRLLAAHFIAKTPATVRTIQVAVDRVQQIGLIAKYRTTLMAVLFVALVVSSFAAHVIARGGIHPIIEVTATARRIRSTTLHERIDEGDFPAELSALADTFNEMLDRLQDSFDRLSRFSADIAHELRTPVNNLRGEAEVTLSKTRSLEEYRESLGSCLEESVRLSRIIDGLLLMARAETPQAEIQRESVDLALELAALQEFYEAATAEAGIRLEVESTPGLRIHASRSLIQRAVGNLVENAIAHTPPGGEIRVTTTENSGRIHVTVCDTGCGIPAEAIPFVFDRFYRVQSDRSSTSGGSGLGLAIVRRIVELHGGEVSLQSAIGAGTTVTLLLPAAG